MNSNLNFAKNFVHLSTTASLPTQSLLVSGVSGQSGTTTSQTNADELFLRQQDNEIQLLETIKRFLNSKLKIDKDYALNLNSLINQHRNEKTDTITTLSNGCDNLLRTWNSILDDLKSFTKLIARNCETIETNILQTIADFYSEKKSIRKIYTNDFNGIHQQFLNLYDDVSKKRVDYKKCLDDYKFTRSRFEDFFIKCGKSGRKVDDFRDKYQKACRKLHLTHNEYVLLLSEASEYEKDYKLILLPNLIEVQASIQNSFFTKWQKLFKDIINSLNMNDESSEIFSQKLLNSIDTVTTNEQNHLNEKLQLQNSIGSIFKFDENLVDDISGKLLPNKLAVDNLTIEALRQKLSHLEQGLREVHDKLTFLNEKKGQGIAKNLTGATIEQYSKLNSFKEFSELKMKEKKFSQLSDLIRNALNELGCEEIPPGYDNAVDGSDLQDLLHLKGSPYERIIKIKSTCSLNVTASSLTSRPSSCSTTPPPIQYHTPLPNPSTVPLQRTLSNATLPPSSHQKSTQLPASSTSSFAPSHSISSPTYRLANLKPKEDSSASTLSLSQSRPLVEEDWFHGVLPREEVVRLLRVDGDFLVRETIRNDECQIVLSVCWEGHKHFIVQTTNEGYYRFEGPSFATVRELIYHQFASKSAVTSRSGAILKKPIVREQWELNNSDVVLIEKIGKGNFGDVYKAKLQVQRSSSLAGGATLSTTDEKFVAVKTCRLTLPDDHKKKFLQEGRILKQYDHPNIVKLIGICVQKQPVMIVMELVSGGSLLNFLRNKSLTLTEKQLLAMCRDTASGMRYLESKNCIHRDLAARNCLIGHENIVKISDFGMSREEEEYTVSDGLKQIPIKWTAPEALNFGKYTSLCDVWSYGVLVWEIFSRGETPYNGMSNSKAREKIDDGYRLPAPDGTRNEVYSLMLRCWQYEADSRPHFNEIFQTIDSLYSSISNS